MDEPSKFPRIETARLLLTVAAEDTAARMLAFATENREHLKRWEPAAPSGYDTEEYWRNSLATARNDFLQGRSMKLVMFDRADPSGPVLGECNFSNFVRGPFQACYLGYKIDFRWEGRGLMYEALVASIEHAFGPLSLHRIMANYLPINERSGRVLKRLGFTIEGYARDYLRIDGEWRDHILTSLTNPDWKP
jgi:ribosomal-protein-alanine N-acetyltransferase